MRALLTDDLPDTLPARRPAKRRQTTWKRRRVGAFSDVGALATIDGRSREALFLKRVKRELVEHVGGKPSAVQRLLIERAAMLLLRCHQIDERVLSGEVLSDANNDRAIAWQNAARRTIAALGLQPARRPQPTLADLLSGNGRGEAA